ncbi:maleylacetoacetate isomerase [Sphingomonas sp. Leaf357]|uniref:maleylacetoacetate isomerase n=1 Tax=Sphingomonas sp. Leaf357 TaxID=1736350 RepID=UPI0006F9AD33|nr:maleylacetoacetate isomerase [Sphingomonas sp. Leaf357]KQS02891.1 maleylacetoacetate isomerase [Sphingomonas sp. Leaf357]
MIRLYDYWRSSAAYRVRIVLNLKGVEHESVAVNLLAAEQAGPENRARNPQGLVPTLAVDGVMLTQSLAIIDYLDATWPDPPMVPRDPVARAQVLARALVIVADIHPIDNLRVLKRLEQQFGADQPAKDEWYRHWVDVGLDALEAMATGDGPFLGGATPDLSDVCLVPQMYNARRFGMDVSAWPKLAAADAACADMPAFAAAHPDRVKPL